MPDPRSERDSLVAWAPAAIGTNPIFVEGADRRQLPAAVAQGTKRLAKAEKVQSAA